MSYINVNAINNEAGTGAPNFPNGLSVNSNPLPTAGSLSNRNRIINGAMVIDQRNAGAAVTVNDTSEVYTLDRFGAYGQATDGVFTVARSTEAPQGFINSALITVTTADASISASQFYGFYQKIEGYNIADLGWGTANASTVTLSFWVRSSVTGAFGGALRNSVIDRSYPFTYTVSSANTWEKKTIVIAGDTSGTWATGNTMGVIISWSVGDGSNRLSTAGAWTAGNFAGVTGQTNLIATNGATFYITGVQLEAGDTATPFEHRLYGQELALCQRYYQKHLSTGTIGFFGRGNMVQSGSAIPVPFTFPTVMRASPTVTIIGTWDVSNMSQPFSAGPNPSSPALVADSLGVGDGFVYAGSVGVGFSSAAEL